MDRLKEFLIEVGIFMLVWIPAVLLPKYMFDFGASFSAVMAYGFITGITASFLSHLPARWKIEKQKHQ